MLIRFTDLLSSLFGKVTTGLFLGVRGEREREESMCVQKKTGYKSSIKYTNNANNTKVDQLDIPYSRSIFVNNQVWFLERLYNYP